MSHLLDSQAIQKGDLSENDIKSIKTSIMKSMNSTYSTNQRLMNNHKQLIIDNTKTLLKVIQKEKNIQEELQNQKLKLNNFRDTVKVLTNKKKNIEKELSNEHQKAYIYKLINDFKKLKLELKNSLTNNELSQSLTQAQDLVELSNILKAEDNFNSLKIHLFSPILKSNFPKLIILKPTKIEFPDITKLRFLNGLLTIFDLRLDFKIFIWDFIISTFLPSLSKDGIIDKTTKNNSLIFSIRSLSLPHNPTSFLQSANSFFETFTTFLSQNDLLFDSEETSEDSIVHNINNSENLINNNINNSENLINNNNKKKEEEKDDSSEIHQKKSIEDFNYKLQYREKVLSLITDIPGDADGLQPSLDNLSALTSSSETIDANDLIHGSRIPPMLLACRDAISRGQEIWSVLNLMRDMLKNANVPGALKSVAMLGLVFWKDQQKQLEQAINCFVVLNTQESFECMLLYRKALEELNDK